MRYLKIACGVVAFLILASNVWSISRWNESRGVYDDICYLRQAHLFQRFGVGGLDTNFTRDDDHYLASKLKEINFPPPYEASKVPCHSLTAATQKWVLTPPPGTGFALALFPAGFQVIPLYVTATVIVLGFVWLAISRARSRISVVLTAFFGYLALYLMINPTKASYSMAPTMEICAAAGLFTVRSLVATQLRNRIFWCGLTGFLIGLSVDFRLANLFLASGYFLFYLGWLLWFRRFDVILQGAAFGLFCLVGMMPTLIANAINAGSPFATTYAGVDVVPPSISWEIIRQYITNMQFVLLVLAAAWAAVILRLRRESEVRQAAWITIANLAVNLAFFMSHPIYTPYYTVPVAMLSLWTLLFASLVQPAGAVEWDVPAQAAKA